MKNLRLSAVLMLVAALAAGCANTVRGVGADVKGTAQAVEDVVR
ncbi:hypothetical protein [Neomegalonema perideroedes]|nr:hypothetical protein [Neomegalonema perideroedes]